MSGELDVVGIGRIAYGEALELQRAFAEARISKAIDRDLLLLVEHPPIITLGRGSKPKHLTTSSQELSRRGVELHEIERGGDVTFHGPGQLVGYPIFDLNQHQPDLHRFLRQIEESLIRALEAFGIEAGRRTGLTGVWVGERKIASIGIHVKKWVTWHGFALNVTTDLSYFDLIVPCGITDVVMTSVRKELGSRTPRDVWARSFDEVVRGFCEVFDQSPQAVTLEDVKAAVSA
jgi:lipoate-protein ligase B